MRLTTLPILALAIGLVSADDPVEANRIYKTACAAKNKSLMTIIAKFCAKTGKHA